MRLAFAFPSIASHLESSEPEADADHEKASCCAPGRRTRPASVFVANSPFARLFLNTSATSDVRCERRVRGIRTVLLVRIWVSGKKKGSAGGSPREPLLPLCLSAMSLPRQNVVHAGVVVGSPFSIYGDEGVGIVPVPGIDGALWRFKKIKAFQSPIRRRCSHCRKSRWQADRYSLRDR